MPGASEGDDTAATSDSDRLSHLWAGAFGNAYVERNRHAGAGRETFWRRIQTTYTPDSILEVGCNVGANLQWLAGGTRPSKLYGLDVNLGALKELRFRVPHAVPVLGEARSLPFASDSVELVFTVGVLIHLPTADLPSTMNELARVSRRYILCCEYFAETETPVEYRGQRGALFKRDYGHLLTQYVPGLQTLDEGYLDRTQGWDDVTYWLFEKR